MSALLDLEFMLSVAGFLACLIAVPTVAIVVGVRWAFGRGAG